MLKKKTKNSLIVILFLCITRDFFLSSGSSNDLPINEWHHTVSRRCQNHVGVVQSHTPKAPLSTLMAPISHGFYRGQSLSRSPLIVASVTGNPVSFFSTFFSFDGLHTAYRWWHYFPYDFREDRKELLIPCSKPN